MIPTQAVFARVWVARPEVWKNQARVIFRGGRRLADDGGAVNRGYAAGMRSRDDFGSDIRLRETGEVCGGEIGVGVLRIFVYILHISFRAVGRDIFAGCAAFGF